jgi:ubiquitin carboxyl-terminal hydrolase 1
MMFPDQQPHDIFDSDPDFELEYHQDYRGQDPWSHLTSASFILPLLIFLAAATYHIFFILDYDLFSLPELFWNCLVYMTPSRLLDAIESYTSPLRITNPNLRHIPRTHAAKSEAIRRILGLDTGGIIESVAQAGRRRLSTLPGIGRSAQGADGRPPGLGNWDNSCYQNSVLQGLASLDSLSEYLTPKIDNGASETFTKPDMKMAETLRGLIATLNDPANNGRRIWTPATLKSMSSNQQQDAQEYFSKVLVEIDKEIGKVADIMRSSSGLDSDDTGSTSSKSSESLPMSTIQSPLEGWTAQRVACTRCGYSEGLSMTSFNCLTVPLGKAWEYNVAECLDEFTKLEPIEGVECGKCTLLKMHRLLSTMKERVKDTSEDNPIHKQTTERLAAVTEALEEDDYEDKTLLQKCRIPPKSRVTSIKTRQAVISRPPKSLIVHFNRSLFDELTMEIRKNLAAVRFPKILDLGPWCLGSSGDVDDGATEEWLLNPDQSMIAGTTRPSRQRGPLYELRAVVTHFGRHENGHYICYKKHPAPVNEEKEIVEDLWWRLSDDDVMRVSEENVLSQGGVFMLFYDRIESAHTISETSPLLEANLSAFSSDLDAAVSLPLPEDTDSDLDSLIQEPSLTIREENATSASEYDEDENEEQGPQEYRPTQAILVPRYIQKTGVHNDGEATGKQGIMSSGNLLMV